MVAAAAPDAARARAQRAWCLYDWANSAFATSVVAAILPVYFARIAGETHAGARRHRDVGLRERRRARRDGGAVAHRRRARRPDADGANPCCSPACCSARRARSGSRSRPSGAWKSLLISFALAFIAFATGNVLYDSLLPAVAGPAEMDRVSARGFAWGYIGGGVLLAVHLAMVIAPQRFGLPDAATATRVAFATVAAWWLAFSIPLFRARARARSRAPRRARAAAAGGRAAPARAARSAHLREHPDLLHFLVAFWLYSDGIGTIIKMATIYGVEVGIGDARPDRRAAHGADRGRARVDRVWPPREAAGRAARGDDRHRRLRRHQPIRILPGPPVAVLGARRHGGLFQGGTQALSRSMFASLVPRERTGELFGFYSVSEKLAGVVGPVLFGVVTQVTHGGRLATLTLLPLFIGGAWMLTRVDLERGRAVAAAETAGAGSTDARA